MKIFDSNIDDLYVRYFRKKENAYSDRVWFYENNIATIYPAFRSEKLEEIKLDYALCLFEIGRYDKFLDEVDPIIEFVICENIYEYHGENIFNLLLKKKSASLINLKRYEEANAIIKQLLKLEPNNKNLEFYYHKCSRCLSKQKEDLLNGVSIAFLIIGVAFKFVENFFVDPFFNQYLKAFSIITLVLFALGIALLVGNEIIRRAKITHTIKSIRSNKNAL